MFSSSTKLTTSRRRPFLSVATFGGTAQAQNVSNDVVARCSQIVGTMKFEGMPAERNQDTIMRVCQSNSGHLPGAPAETRLHAVAAICRSQRRPSAVATIHDPQRRSSAVARRR